MDPNATHARLARAIHDLDVTRGGDERVVDDVIEAWHDLTNWFERGGFTPSAWAEPQRRALENTRVPCPPPGDTVDEISGLLKSDPWGPEPKLTRQQELLAEHVRREA